MTKKEPYNIQTEEDLNQVLEAIDKELRDEGVPVTARQLKGWLKFSSRFGLGLKMSDPLSQKVMDWFEVRYGDKLKIDYATGEIAVMIRGDLFKMRVPTMYGTVQVICDPRFWMDKLGMQIAVNENGPLPVVNVLNCIDELTESYALTFTLDEQRELFQIFQFANEASQAIDKPSGAPFINEAKGDIQASIAHLFEERPQFGLSKWASLQAVEKFIKAFLSKMGVTPPFTHDLQRLAIMAASHGLAQLAPADLGKIQCSAEVRYGRIVVSAQEAIEAHHTALKVCSEIARSL
ncbi:MAG: HEPN domain-containing protein [Pyrinomonadaceae bacterium]